MKRLLLLLGIAAALSSPAMSTSYYTSPDVPTNNPAALGLIYLPWEVVRNDSGTYNLVQSFPGGNAVNALHRMNNGDWLFSVEVTRELPPGSGAFFEARDLVVFDGVAYNLFFSGSANGLPESADIDAVFLEGGDGGDLVISFDAPTEIAGVTYDPADLVRHAGGAWSLFFDASAATPPIRPSSDVSGADQRGRLTVLTFDVPTTLGGVTYLPGELVSWNPVASVFSSYYADPNWPRMARNDGLSFLATPGRVPPSVSLTKSMLVAGDLTIAWSPSCSAGAEDYGIYEGSMGSWASHASVTCTDALADLTEELTPASGHRYYLVVPHHASDEGSYGLDSSGTERPAGGSPCRPTRELDPCP